MKMQGFEKINVKRNKEEINETEQVKRYKKKKKKKKTERVSNCYLYTSNDLCINKIGTFR